MQYDIIEKMEEANSHAPNSIKGPTSHAEISELRINDDTGMRNFNRNKSLQDREDKENVSDKIKRR